MNWPWEKRDEKPVSGLSERDRNDLIAYASSPGYKVVLDIMQQLCEAAETAHFRHDPKDGEGVLVSHAEARSFRVFFERFQKRVNWELQEGIQPSESQERDLDDPEVQGYLLDPLRFQ